MVGPSSQISKILLLFFFVLVIFYIYMDVQLYLRIQNYPIDRSFHFNVTTPTILGYSSTNSLNTAPVAAASNSVSSNSNNNNLADIRSSLSSSAITSLSSSSSAMPHDDIAAIISEKTVVESNIISSKQRTNKYEDNTWVPYDINPLYHITVKAIMLDHTNHYIFAPLATLFDNVVGLSKSKFITPNMISFFHVLVACASGRLIASDSLVYRRFGVVLFQFRTFLDDLDGHVARVRKHIRGERSEIGTSGYYIDGICDGLGCIALMIGIVFFLKNNPPRRGYTQLQAIHHHHSTTESKNSDTGGGGGGGGGITYKVKVTTKKVARKVLCFSGQLLLSSTAWNRYIALYQDMLERNDVTPIQFIRQNFIFKSTWFFSIAWLWRVFNIHALLHCILLSIFCDKLWDFLIMIQYSGYVVLLVAICATEMHVLEVQNFIFNSLTGNNTSL